MARTKQLTRIGRWSLVAAALLIGGALLATVMSTNRSVEDATDTLTRGQATTLFQAMRSELRGLGGPPTADDLEAILAELQAQGVEYIAILGPAGIESEAGTPPADRAGLAASARRQRTGQPVEINGRVRIVSRRGRRARRPRRAPAFVLEFSPKLAADLESAARRSLTIGVLAVGVLLLAALGLVRWLSRRETIERELEHGKRLASLGQMSAVLAHEIRNPLASLKGNAQLLERSVGDDDKARSRATRVVDEAIRLEGLTNDLLEFAREGEIERTDIDPAQLVLGTAETAGSDRIDVDVEHAPATWPLDGDRMRQVLGNLVENALGASPDERVAVSAAKVGGKLELVVRDRGNGIADEDLDKLFEPFFTRKTRGTGLGLAVAKRIVELHGGTITAANAADGGAEFRVIIPRS